MLIFLIVIVGLSLLILGHEAGHFFAAKFFKLRVDEFGFGFPPRIFARRRGETEYSVNWLPFGGFVKIAGERGEFVTREENVKREAESEEEKKRLFYAQSAGRKAVITAAGVAVNFILGWLMISLVLMIGAAPVVAISGIALNSPAALSGLAAGDILADFTEVEQFRNFIKENRGREITLTVRRGGEEVVVTVTPRTEAPQGQGLLGVELAEGGVPRHNPIAALLAGFRQSLLISWGVLVALGNLILTLFTQGALLEGIVGPVGIFSVAYQAGELGAVHLLALLALISLNLTVVNLLPFPALDGGRLLLIAVEKLKGSPLPYKIEAAINAVGFAFLIVLMVLITVRDILNL
jgi:regulator of sigma E protease